MSNEIRVRQNFLGGLVDTADLSSSGTTLNSAGLAAATTAIGSTNHMAITLDPDGIYGAPEIAYITSLTVGATSATILRGQEGTTARAHLIDTPWVHAPTVADYNAGAVQIAKTTLGAAAASISFTNIPPIYTNLLLVVMARGVLAAATDALRVQFNGDTAANYDYEWMRANATTVTAGEGVGQTSAYAGDIAAASASSNLPGTVTILIPGYLVTSFNKVWTSQGFLTAGYGTGNFYSKSAGGAWRSGAAITRVDVFAGGGNLDIGSVATLYGEV